jgi:ATP-dependent DNA helicase RecQ
MGINWHNVQVPCDAESYVQQIGRAGRVAFDSYAVMLYSKQLLQNCEPSMVNYTKNNTVCRRQLLFQDFENTSFSTISQSCKCCDVCTKQCKCNSCVESLTHDYSFIPSLFNLST